MQRSEYQVAKKPLSDGCNQFGLVGSGMGPVQLSQVHPLELKPLFKKTPKKPLFEQFIPNLHPQPPPTSNLRRASVHRNIRRASLNLQRPSTQISVAPSSRSVLLLPSLPLHFNHVSWLANPLANRERAESEEERGRTALAGLGAAVAVIDDRGREKRDQRETWLRKEAATTIEFLLRCRGRKSHHRLLLLPASKEVVASVFFDAACAFRHRGVRRVEEQHDLPRDAHTVV
ncbi:hypothetical protein PIB30_072094 [Stylosanthes scabra]|uniref:Uncharacterized protein n=1 Tax=Stylosanthes scabra TaxID=79078 RepID=A0ABU6VQU0_9FABA|nr:hypothetical protein [Stylosanthes scabra]